MKSVIKFIFAWITWVFIVMMSLLCSLFTWSWKETQTMDMKIIMTEVFGKDIWRIMLLGHESNDNEI